MYVCTVDESSWDADHEIRMDQVTKPGFPMVHMVSVDQGEVMVMSICKSVSPAQPEPTVLSFLCHSVGEGTPLFPALLSLAFEPLRREPRPGTCRDTAVPRGVPATSCPGSEGLLHFLLLLWCCKQGPWS